MVARIDVPAAEEAVADGVAAPLAPGVQVQEPQLFQRLQQGAEGCVHEPGQGLVDLDLGLGG